MTPLDGAGLVLRVDASLSMGTGHVMRCLALAQAWQDAGGVAELVTTSLLPALALRLAHEKVPVHTIDAAAGSPADVASTVDRAERLRSAWVVVDGYHLGSSFDGKLSRPGIRVLRVDDDGRSGRAIASLVLDQNLAADVRRYRGRSAGTELLLGPDFALLRRELRAAIGPRPVAPVGRRVLVLMGGTDPANATTQTLDGLRRHGLPPGAEVAVVVARANPHRPAIEAGMAALGPGARLLVEPADLPDWLRWADLAVSAGGTTVWELCALGVPALLVAVADNQRPNVRALARAGAALDLGDVADLDPARIGQAAALLGDAAARGKMAERGRDLVDGRGARRVLTAMAALESLRLRPARRDDAERLFAWANDPVTRDMSFQGEAIPWATHLRWLESSLGGPDRSLWIAEWRAGDEWLPFGQVRLDRGGVVSLGLDPAWRGRGLAAPVLRRALAEQAAEDFGPVYTAYIRAENEPSRRAFRQAGFVDRGDDLASGVPCRRYVRDDGPPWAANGGES